jgi:D-glycero-alpha-D-manno-heptose-7-phosphate kinase
MLLVKSPFRVSLFGGSTDYKEFYQKQDSFIIGFAIDKYIYLSVREKPKILPQDSTVSYSKLETFKHVDEIENPLIRETFRYFNLKKSIEFISFPDIPSRTGLGGSSSYCVGMSYLMRKFLNLEISKKIIAKDAIEIERNILKESGGIQDQIWAAYGGLNTISIDSSGDFAVKPLPITEDFKKELKNSMVLIYTNEQRESNEVAKSHEKQDKMQILELAHQAYSSIMSEDIQKIGQLLHRSWLAKRKISNQISTNSVDNIISTCLSMGAFGAKLLGAGGCGFVLVMCDLKIKSKINEVFSNNILEFEFDYSGVSTIFDNT